MQEDGGVPLTPKEQRPSPVPEPAKQDGDAAGRWAWAEPAVWSERLLTTLEQGVQGGIWFSLIDKVFAERNLRTAAAKVVANHGSPGVDHVTVETFFDDREANVTKLTTALRKSGMMNPGGTTRID